MSARHINIKIQAGDFLIALLITFIAALILLSTKQSWETWKPATCMPDFCFCEHIRSGTIRQPANTWSSFGFIFLGVWVIRQSRRDVKNDNQFAGSNLITTKFVYGAIYGLALILIGLGSGFYHASLTFYGQFADVMGMYLLACFILLYNLSRRYNPNNIIITISYVLLNTVLAVLLLNLPFLRRYLFALLLIAALIPEYVVLRANKAINKSHFIKAALAVLLFAFGIWILDTTKILCMPDSWVQGHAIWHILCAISAGLLYLHYRSETNIARA
ncbi:MAG TPA: ceramidase domain-containing protein [Pyrinomonadaceae bacterium]|jgi:hypothetical protein